MNQEDKHNISYFFKLQNTNVGRCLYPFGECTNNPINAHSIQNSKTFDLLHMDNHVIRIKSRYDNNLKRVINFESVGRNEASKFFGLCEKHDNNLFEPIDKFPIDRNNLEQLFLIAYRSLLKEFHATISGFIKIQQVYQHKISKGYVPGSNKEIESQALNWYIKAFELNTFKESIDHALLNKKFEFFTHHILTFSTNSPTLACSQLFSADSIKYNDDVLRIFLNVIPQSRNSTLVIFSSTNEESHLAKSYLERCLAADPFYSKYEISKIVIRNCENFFLNPGFVSKWGQQKKNVILEYYWSGIEYDDDTENNIEFYLFDDLA